MCVFTQSHKFKGAMIETGRKYAWQLSKIKSIFVAERERELIGREIEYYKPTSWFFYKPTSWLKEKINWIFNLCDDNKIKKQYM